MRQPPNTLRHLPRWSQNILYISALALSPVINYFVGTTTFQEVGRVASDHGRALPKEHWVFLLSHFIIAGILVFLGINLVRTLIFKHQKIRKSLLIFGILASLDLLLNLGTVVYSIYSFKVGSFFLLATSLGIYVSINLTFFFWYWFVDYPTQMRHQSQQDRLCSIVFPRESMAADPRWLPTSIDYLYFTVMTSNTLGAPENHSPVGVSIKFLQLMQSTVMLLLLVLLVSRAVNTLS